MTAKSSAPQDTTPAGREESATDQGHRLAAHNNRSVGQIEGDALFQVGTGAYGTTAFRLPEVTSPSEYEVTSPSVPASERKSTGMRRVKLAVDPYDRARHEQIVRDIPPGTQFTSELIRLKMGDNIMPPGAWGSLLSAAAKAGLVKRTGEYRPSTRPSRAGAVVAVWVRLP